MSEPALDSIRLPMQCVPEALYPEVKQMGCENDHSSPFGAKVMNMCCSIQQRNKFSCG